MIRHCNLFTPFQIEQFRKEGKSRFLAAYKQGPQNNINKIKDWIENIDSLSMRLKKEKKLETPFIKNVMCEALGHTLIGESSHVTLVAQDANSEDKIPDIKIGNFDSTKLSDLSKLYPDFIMELKGPSCINFRRTNKRNGEKHSPMKQVISDMFREGEGCKFSIVTNMIEFEIFSREFAEKRSMVINLQDLNDADDFYLFYAFLGSESLLIDNKKIVTEFKRLEQNKLNLTSSFHIEFKQCRNKMFDCLDGKLSDENANSLVTKILAQALFTIYAETIGLLPEGALINVLELSDYSWGAYLKFVSIIDKGGMLEGNDIFGYNGGLFKPNTLFSVEQSSNFLKPLKKLLKFRFLYMDGTNLTKDDLRDVLGRMLEHSLEVNEEEKLFNFTKEGKFAEARKKQASKNDRQKKGVFYTPNAVTNYMVQRVIELLDMNKKNISKTTWLDCASGSGAFLTEVFQQLVEIEKEKVGLKDTIINKYSKLSSLQSGIEQQVISRISGIDIDKLAVGVAQLNLSLSCVRPDTKLPTLTKMICEGDALFDESEKKYDVIISNPPYMQWRYIPKNYRSWMLEDEDYKNFAEDSADYSSFFFLSAWLKLKPGGILAFISTNKTLATAQGKNFRSWLLKKFDIVELLDFRKSIFKGTDIEPCIFILRKKDKTIALPHYLDVNEFVYEKNKIEVTARNKVRVSLLTEGPYLAIPTRTTPDILAVWDWYKKNTKSFQELGTISKIKAGLRITDIASAEVITKKPSSSIAHKYENLIDGPCLTFDESKIDNVSRWISKKSIKINNWREDLHSQKSKCLLIKELSTKPCVVVHSGIPACLNSIGVVVPHDFYKVNINSLRNWMLHPFVESFMDLWFGANRTHSNQRWKNSYISVIPVPKDSKVIDDIPDAVVKNCHYFVCKLRGNEEKDAA